MHWYWEVLNKYAEFSGRARRKEYWMFYLVNSIISFLLGLASGFISPFKMLTNIYIIATVIPSLAVSVRRLHDTGRSTWWVLTAWLPAGMWFILAIYMVILGQSISSFMGLTWIFIIIALIISLVAPIIFFKFMIEDSTPGENQYGPNPKEEPTEITPQIPEEMKECPSCEKLVKREERLCLSCGYEFFPKPKTIEEEIRELDQKEKEKNLHNFGDDEIT